MPAFSGSFSGRVTSQSAFSVADQPNHLRPGRLAPVAFL